MEFKHTSVLLKETIDNLHIKPDGVYLDGTLGGGGHSFYIVSRLSKAGRLIGIDQDEDAIEEAGRRLSPYAVSCWIWEYPLINSIMQREVFPTNTIPSWTCGWTGGRH